MNSSRPIQHVEGLTERIGRLHRLVQTLCIDPLQKARNHAVKHLTRDGFTPVAWKSSHNGVNRLINPLFDPVLIEVGEDRGDD